MRAGARTLAERAAAMSAREWREFWSVRGMRELQLVLWAGWDPIGSTPTGEYDRYAFRIASLLGSRASREALADELGRIRRNELGLEPDPAQDFHAAGKVADWFEHTVGTRSE
jgi:hypothetical protein